MRGRVRLTGEQNLGFPGAFAVAQAVAMTVYGGRGDHREAFRTLAAERSRLGLLLRWQTTGQREGDDPLPWLNCEVTNIESYQPAPEDFTFPGLRD